MQRVLLAVLMAAGCAKSAPVNLSMVNTAGTPFDITLRYLELEHADDGWIRVNLSVPAANMDRLKNGEVIQLASPEVPKGEYTGARVAYTTMGMDAVDAKASGDDPDRLDESARETKGVQRAPTVEPRDAEVTAKSNFCLKKDETVALSVRQADTSLRLEVDGPGC